MSDDSPHRPLNLRRLNLPSPGVLLICTALVVIAALALRFGVHYQRQQSLIEHIEELGGRVRIEKDGPEWAHNLVVKVVGADGARGFGEIVSINFAHSEEVADDDLEVLSGLASLRELNLFDTRITDAGMQHLNGLPELSELSLFDTQVSDARVEELRGQMPDCEIHTGSLLFFDML